jgi:hypothetical protein
VSGPYYDPEVEHCSSSNPCTFPLFGQTGSPTGDEVNSLFISEVNKLTGGAVQMTLVDVNFITIVINGELGPGQNPMPLYGLGWAPDYPDPTDYVTPLYYENASYTYSGSFAESLYVPQFGASTCVPATDWPWYSNTSNVVPQDCQGTAYKALIHALGVASTYPAGLGRVALYAAAEQIASKLALYVYTSQGNGFGVAAAWININSLNTNPTMGAGGDTPYFWLQGNGLTPTST